MIITKDDIGRKAVARDGKILTFIGGREFGNYPFIFMDENGDRYEYTIYGCYLMYATTDYDLIRWADETEDAQ